MNRKQYLKRINHPKIGSPSLSLLKSLQSAHIHHIPFENLDIHYDRPISLHPKQVYRKIIRQNRGGFCYELNGMFYELLSAIGFKVDRISGRVYDPKNGRYGKEFDHMTLLVHLKGNTYLVDVGFGTSSFTSPLKIELNTIQKDDKSHFIIEKSFGDYYRLSKIVEEQKVPKYLFTTRPRQVKDYMEMCFHHQTSPDSHFTKKKFISLLTKEGSIMIIGKELTIKEKKKETKVQLKNDKALKKALWKYFEVKIPRKKMV